MGYDTRYKLTVNSGQPVALGIFGKTIEEFRKAYEYADLALDDFGDPEEPCTWYTHEAELVAFSRLHPGYVFTLHGEGEDSGDIWKLYVKNGEATKSEARVEFDPCPYHPGT